MSPFPQLIFETSFLNANLVESKKSRVQTTDAAVKAFSFQARLLFQVCKLNTPLTSKKIQFEAKGSQKGSPRPTMGGRRVCSLK